MESIGLIERTAELLAKIWVRSWLVQPVRHRVHRLNLALQTALIKHSLKKCGKNVRIQPPSFFAQPDHIEIGNDSSFSGFGHIYGAGGVRIGDRVMVGSHTAISSITHDYNQDCMIDTVVLRPVVIEDDVWLGAHVSILPGVTIGRGAVVGAGAVVTKDVPAGAIAVGVPAAVIKFRSLELVYNGARVMAVHEKR
jgi:maltose O-acetyltransferase